MSKPAANPKAMTPQKIKATYERAMRLTRTGRGKQAEALWRKLIEMDPGNAVFWNNLGNALEQTGQLGDAIASFEKALSFKPLPETHFSLARLYETSHRLEEAINHTKACIELSADDGQAWQQLGMLYHLNLQPEHAILVLLKAFRDFGEHRHLRTLALVLRSYNAQVYRDELREAVLLCLNDKRISSEEFFLPWINLLLVDPRFAEIKAVLKIDDYNAFSRAIRPLLESAVWQDPFLLKGIEVLCIQNARTESFMTRLRRYLLLRYSRKETLPHDLMELAFVLSMQCYGNEYVWMETEDEKAVLELLEKEYKTVKSLSDGDVARIMLFSCFRPLSRIGEIRNLISQTKSSRLTEICRLQIDEPEEERKIAGTIVPIGTIENEVSGKVRQQYEENPYPRWRFVMTDESDESRKNVTREQSLNILVAGCGTGRHAAITRFQFPSAHITAVDLSQASLAYAIRKCRSLGLENIEFFQADILNLGDMGKKFDIIESVGVLHHMEDPLAGWRVLTSILKPGGHMKIGLYSEIAREFIVKARDMIAEKGFDPTPDGIRACREEIKKHKRPNPILDITDSPDFYSLSTCRDLLFHVQEHRFTIPDIQKAIAELGLEFMFFSLKKPQFRKAYNDRYPEDPDGKNLDNWAQFEEEHRKIFRGMYVFWCRKKA